MELRNSRFSQIHGVRKSRQSVASFPPKGASVASPHCLGLASRWDVCKSSPHGTCRSKPGFLCVPREAKKPFPLSRQETCGRTRRLFGLQGHSELKFGISVLGLRAKRSDASPGRPSLGRGAEEVPGSASALLRAKGQGRGHGHGRAWHTSGVSPLPCPHSRRLPKCVTTVWQKALCGVQSSLFQSGN